MLTSLRRWWYRRQVDGEAMAAYLDAGLPGRRAAAGEVEYLAVDLETTGLDAGSDVIVSVGYVPVVERRIQCRAARHAYVRIDRSVEQSATIHHILDADLDQARSEADVLADLLEALAGRVLLVHHAPMDLAFLHAACRRHYGVPLLTRVVDTLDLARRRRQRGDKEIREGELRLDALRRSYGLPRYPAHDALTDALSTAELFLAMLPTWGDDSLPLRLVLR
jgi:DNA polymerase-3 subunit epsilon